MSFLVCLAAFGENLIGVFARYSGKITPDEDTRLECRNVGITIRLGFVIIYLNQSSERKHD
jgi:hypothetical protein